MRVLYDGSPASVQAIMDIVGTEGVNNCDGNFCMLPKGRSLLLNDQIVSDGACWWIESVRFVIK